MSTKPELWLALVVVIVAAIGITNCQCDKKTPWHPTIKDGCPARAKELAAQFPEMNLPHHHLENVYTERDHRGYYSNLCCLPGTDKNKIGVSVKSCATTSCIPSSVVASSKDNICPTREYQGRTIHMEPVLRDSCRLDNNGQSGLVTECCPKNSTEGMLLSQYGAELSEFPHQAGLNVGGTCGGTIYGTINKRYILTAAHCIVDHQGKAMSPEQITVQLGTNLGGAFGFDSNDTKYAVEEVIEHKNYSKRFDQPEFPDGIYYNDIALLRLKRDIEFGPTVKSLQIAPKGFRPEGYGRSVVIAGWGTTDTLDTSPHLQKANLLIRNGDSCFRSYPYGDLGYANHSEGLLCLGGIHEMTWSPTAGSGDSGGPAVCRGPDDYAVLCGVTSFGGDDKVCAEYEMCPPSVYTKVEHFRDWIEERAKGQDPSTFFRYKLYGEEAPADKYRHQVHITSSSGKSCGGTLINKNTVVTAAQCVIKDDGSMRPHRNLEVRIGMKDLSIPGKSVKVKQVAGVKGFERVGPPVNTSTQGRSYYYSRIQMMDNYHKNDVAIIKLAEDVTDIPESQFAKLLPTTATRTDPTGNAIELSFPRRRNMTTTTSNGSTKLMTREFKFVDRQSCQDRLSRLSAMGVKTELDQNVMCAVERYSGGSTCDRELGGGLICQGPSGEDVLCGVQIFRLCEFAVPNGFASMGRYAKWVEKASKKLDELK